MSLLLLFPRRFDDIRQDIIDGLDSAQSESTGWNAEVRDKLAVTSVVRTSDTVVTITLSAQAGYDVTAQETITVTVPASAVSINRAITAEPTFTVDVASDSHTGSGSFTATLVSSMAATAVLTFVGTGAPTTALSASGSGTAVQTFVGSGSFSTALSASMSGTAVQTFVGSGSFTTALSASMSGTAVLTFVGTGAPTTALSASMTGTAVLTFVGTGTPTTALSASMAGTATQTFVGTGAPTTALVASMTGTATMTPSVSFTGEGDFTATLVASMAADATMTPGEEEEAPRRAKGRIRFVDVPGEKEEPEEPSSVTEPVEGTELVGPDALPTAPPKLHIDPKRAKRALDKIEISERTGRAVAVLEPEQDEDDIEMILNVLFEMELL